MGSRKRTRPRLIGERQGQFDGGIEGQDMNGDQEAGMASPLPQELVDCNGCAIQDGRVVMEVFGAGDDSVQSPYSDQIVESSEEDADLGQRVESGDPRGVPSLGKIGRATCRARGGKYV